MGWYNELMGWYNEQDAGDDMKAIRYWLKENERELRKHSRTHGGGGVHGHARPEAFARMSGWLRNSGRRGGHNAQVAYRAARALDKEQE